MPHRGVIGDGLDFAVAEPDETIERESGAPAPVSPPVELLAATGGVLVLVVALFVWASPVANLTGYLLACFVGLSLVASYRRVDAGRRGQPTYSPEPGAKRAADALAVLCLGVASVHVWFLAERIASWPFLAGG
jgi:hypothetical protein